MKIDFHHAATYVIARCAGFAVSEATTIAHAAQYVDDATNAGVIKFDVGAMYERTSSAHSVHEAENFDHFDNRKVWLPFHFLPSNDGRAAGEPDPPGAGFIPKLVCRPGNHSPIAAEMVARAIADHDAPYHLHRLGITMHVYADTWAHQGFAGVRHRVNTVCEPRYHQSMSGLVELTKKLGKISPKLGHGEAGIAPDEPYLIWSYENGEGKRVERNNPAAFESAANWMCKVMRAYHAAWRGSAGALTVADAAPLLDHDARQIQVLLTTVEPSVKARYRAWAEALETGHFSFGAEPLPAYVRKGEGSWKHAALGTRDVWDKLTQTFHYTPAFLTSDWKRFHDALLRHRFVVLHEILPRYGICAI